MGNHALPSWRDRAACTGEDPDVFFPLTPADPDAAKAKAVCRRCPSAPACLQFAFALGAIGVWGGTTEDERRNLRRRERIAARKADAA